MSNSYFQFKQFTIHQDKCAMKVCTDSCLFGAWIANYIKGIKLEKALDIGAGTGLLSLMFAQRNDSLIDALEIDLNAAQQAQTNIWESPWKNKINIIHQSLQGYKPQEAYDFIFSNPPFFEDDLTSVNVQKNQAKHDASLTLKELIHFITLNLKDNGRGALLIPYHRLEYLESLLIESNFNIEKLTLVKQTPQHQYFRAMIIFSKSETHDYKSDEIIIHDAERKYTDAFIELLKDYYLNF